MKNNEIQWKTMKLNEKMKLNETQWKTMKLNEKQWNSMKNNETRWNSMKNDGTQSKTMKLNGKQTRDLLRVVVTFDSRGALAVGVSQPPLFVGFWNVGLYKDCIKSQPKFRKMDIIKSGQSQYTASRNEKRWNSMKNDEIHETRWKTMKRHEKQWNSMKKRWNSMKLNEKR